MEKNVFELIIDENFETLDGVRAISLVETPAIGYEFLKFNKEKPFLFDISNNERREMLGVVMLPDTPIFRRSKELGEHYVYFSKETIKAILQKFSKEKRLDLVTLHHEINTQGVYLFESYLVDRANGITPPTAFEQVPDGTWIGRFKVENEEVWNAVKNNEFKGFSVEGLFAYNFEAEPTPEKEEIKQAKELFKIISKLLTNLKKTR